MNDEDLTRRLQAAFPKATAREVNERQARARDEIVAQAIPSNVTTLTPKRARVWAKAVPIAASVVLAAIVSVALVLVLLKPPAAFAATPPPLQLNPVEGTAQELLTEIATSVRAQGLEAEPTIRYQQWGLSFDAESEEPPQQIMPEAIEVQYFPDGSSLREARAAETFDASGRPVENADAPAGSLLWELQTEPGEHSRLFTEPPPSDASDVEQYFDETGFVVNGTSGEYFQMIKELLREWSLTSDQASALIAYLATLPDVSVVGSTVDRLGREGIAFTADTAFLPDYLDTFVLSGTEGFLSYEWTYTGSERTDIVAPAVLEYTAWQTGRE